MGTERKTEEFVPQVLTFMPVLTFKEGESSRYFDKSNKNITDNKYLKKLHIDNHTTRTQKEKIIGIF